MSGHAAGEAAALPNHPSGSPPAGLLGKLMAAVRPEFRVDVLVADSTDPMIGPAACAVAGCDRVISGRGLCNRHLRRWVNAGRPDLAEFTATVDPRQRRHQPNLACRVEGCNYGSASNGLCDTHAYRWKRAAETDLETWLRSQQSIDSQPPVHAACRVNHCQLWPRRNSPFCRSHHSAWSRHGRPDVAEFVAKFAFAPAPPPSKIRLGTLPPQLKLEIQYALQCRYDERRGRIWPISVAEVVSLLSQSGARY